MKTNNCETIFKLLQPFFAYIVITGSEQIRYCINTNSLAMTIFYLGYKLYKYFEVNCKQIPDMSCALLSVHIKLSTL